MAAKIIRSRRCLKHPDTHNWCDRCHRLLCCWCSDTVQYQDVSISNIDDTDIKRLCLPCLRILRRAWKAFLRRERVVIKALRGIK